MLRPGSLREGLRAHRAPQKIDEVVLTFDMPLGSLLSSPSSVCQLSAVLIAQRAPPYFVDGGSIN